MFSKLCTVMLLTVLTLGVSPIAVMQAQPINPTVDVENEEYSPGADVTVSGVGSPGSEVVLQVFNPRNSMVDIDIMRCGANGAYNKTFRTPYNQTGGWMAGNYTVRAYLNGGYATDSFILAAPAGESSQNATGAPPPGTPAGNLATINLGTISLSPNATSAGNQTGATNLTGAAANMTGATGNLTNAGSPQAATYMNNQSFTRLANTAPAPTVGLELVVEGLNAPLALVSANDGSGRLYIVDQIGVVRVIENDSLADEPFLDLRSRIVNLSPAYDERGLLGLAFHPDYEDNGKLYVFYSAPLRSGAPADWDCTNYLSEFTVSNSTNKVNMSSERVLMAIDKPYTNHNGGPILFGSDGYLYMLTGDGGRADDTGRGHNATIGNGQDLMTVLGKVLRIDVDQTGARNMTQTANMTAAGNQTGTANMTAAGNQTGANTTFIAFTGNSSSGTRPYGIPQDNPFVSNASAVPEIYALGFRNPAFASFYSNMSDVLFVADAGQALFEEIDMVLKGGNYGWRIREGTHCFNASDHFSVPANCTSTGYNGEPLIGPIVECGHDLGVVIVGGNVYNGSNMTAFRGKYFFGIFSSSAASANGSILVATPPSGWNISSLPASARNLTSAQNAMWTIDVVKIANSSNGQVNHYVRGFGVDQAGELYVLTNDLLGPVSNGTTGKVYKLVAANATAAGNQTGATANMTGAANATTGGIITIVVTMSNRTSQTYGYNVSQTANMTQYGAGVIGPLIIINVFIENSTLVFSTNGPAGPGTDNATGSPAPGLYGYGWDNMWQTAGPGWHMGAGNVIVIVNIFIEDSSLQFYAGNFGYPITPANSSTSTNMTAP